MKIKGTVLGSTMEEYVVPKWSTDEDRPMKRHGIKDKVSRGDISSSSSNKGLGDKFFTPWLLYSVSNLEEYEE
jgi:hypothetical protein